ncbi:hypothetical protein [Shewanella maritima]|uniref:hypothetical protein n=1 Tax=Shewanella maritima TaxID=2520507 RepID=UPI003735BB8E
MRQQNRQKHFKTQQRNAFIRRNYYFIVEQQNQQNPLPKIDEFENLKQLLEDKKCQF